MKIAKPLVKLIESFEKLPGIGPKSAQRLAFYLVHVPQHELDSFAEAVSDLKKNTVICSLCKNVSEEDPCPICTDINRDQETVLVVEQPIDVLAFERAGRYKGVYHVLHGVINPLENIGPDEIFIDDLIKRLKNGTKVQEVIVATNPTMEGEATAMYISKRIKVEAEDVKVTRLGMGIPTGADLEYADDVTLTQAIEGRRQI